MNNTPQVETREISDADLDNVAGGLVAGLAGNVVSTVDSIAPVSSTVGTVVGTVEATTGLNTAPLQGLATSTVAGL
ncbi:type A2 lantipeptide [Streptomyces sp. B-S-A8]|uniref:Type A2 lantipeptide n=1 Tax=Streptomyces solicavernae TaxID=3043614 RepID=A0ABT6RTZ1_9ACTN|nr:type A2 lantipeptide [Streptomyces sp. B-S-A8]MDI3387905.1 type A2 lantipeptide [Streptomyces sp. B-S-A8]